MNYILDTFLLSLFILTVSQISNGFPVSHQNLRCGNYSFEKRIIGGKAVSIGKYPFLVQIYDSDEEIVRCSGVLIAANLVFTSGRCLKQHGNIPLKAILGKDFSDPSIQEFYSQTTIIREYSYNKGFDITIGKLEKPVEYNAYIQPFHLDPESVPAENPEVCFVAGWGSPKRDYLMNSEALKEMDVEIYRQDECGSYSGSQYFICGGNRNEPRKALCYFDQGSPLICQWWRSETLVTSLMGMVIQEDDDCGASLGKPIIFADIHKASWWLRTVQSIYGV